MFQAKEQDNNAEEQLSEVEISNLPEKELRNDSKDDPRFFKTNGGTN